MDHTIIQKEIEFALQNKKNPQHLFDLVHSLRPYDISEVLRELSLEEQLDLISKLPIVLAAESLEYLEPEVQYHILRHLKDSIASPLLKQMSSDAVVDMLLAIHPLQAQRLLDLLPEDYRDKINQLMTYPEYTAGSLMTVDYIAARAYWNGEQTLSHIRKVGHEAEIVSYIYVTDIRGELVGVCSLKEIILARPDTRLGEIAIQDIITVPADMEQEEVANILSRYDFYALPVVDQQNRLKGIITVDDVVDVIQEEATEDFQKMGGSSPLSEPYFKTSTWELFRKRIIWLLVLFIGGAYTANVLEKFSDTLSKIVELSFFIPLLTGTGGNTASQIVTTLVRALGMGEVTFKDIFRVIRKEIITGCLLGLSLGFIMYIRAVLMGVQTNVGWVVSISILIIVLWSSLVSAILPLILHRLKVDPAVVSNPLITTLVDGTGLIIYFTTAKLLLHL
ncbi:magnesium transporter [Thermoflavimicrobium daqui]|uniref:Magnesium transporter MgtE n=1 Tax=Thermoflavimicrobium daqui TaxID=2137476 RepID=A0A364K9H1_9BACL|nr:magnesium transporter [Thermoflavimicrobium daqui]RAL26862.1 magnesium transporter [Thermoflavimicrobium daqui]